MFKYYSSYALLWMGLTHLLCCGLPLILSIVPVICPRPAFNLSVALNWSVILELNWLPNESDWHWLDVCLGSPGAKPADCKKGPTGLHFKSPQLEFIYSFWVDVFKN